jgi:thiol-disulfide isomerase/thioredoxin
MQKYSVILALMSVLIVAPSVFSAATGNGASTSAGYQAPEFAGSIRFDVQKEATTGRENENGCEPSPQIKRALIALPEHDDRIPVDARRREKLEALKLLLKKFPGDLFLNRRFQDIALIGDLSNRLVLAQRYRELLAKQPSNPVFLYLYGRLLIGRNTPEAKSIFARALQEDARFPWAHLGMADVHNVPRYKDKKSATVEIANFLHLCPGTLSSEFYSRLSAVDDVTLLNEAALQLRNRLTTVDDREDFHLYPALWKLEFRTRPISGHPAVRERVQSDLEKLRLQNFGGNIQWLETLHAGYRVIGDETRKRWAEDEIFLQFPNSRSAVRLITGRWRDENPYPDSASQEQVQAYYRKLLTITNDWIRKWPTDPTVCYSRFDALVTLDESSLSEVEAAFDALQKTSRETTSFLSIPPASIRLSELYLKKGVNLRQIPELVSIGFKPFETLAMDQEKSDSRPSGQRSYAELNLSSVYWSGWPVLAEAYIRTNQLLRAREVLGQMHTALLKEKPNADSYSHSAYLTRQALYLESAGRLAEAKGRKLDALMFYHRSRVTRSPTGPHLIGEVTKVSARMRRLWNTLGGTKESWVQLFEGAENTSTLSASTTGAWQKSDRILADFNLNDLNGRTWRLSDLKGKTVFVNIWATWCAPCKEELPFVQRLYVQMKNNPDVTILSLNVDEDVSLVEPYVKQNGLTLPVLPAYSYVRSMLSTTVLPRSWIIGPDGTLRNEQIGFGRDGEGWLLRATNQIQLVKAAP